MAAPKGVLRIKNGNVILYNIGNQIQRIYYNGGKAQIANWFDSVAESVQIQLNTGVVIIVNKSCQIINHINS